MKVKCSQTQILVLDTVKSWECDKRLREACHSIPFGMLLTAESEALVSPGAVVSHNQLHFTPSFHHV